MNENAVYDDNLTNIQKNLSFFSTRLGQSSVFKKGNFSSLPIHDFYFLWLNYWLIDWLIDWLIFIILLLKFVTWLTNYIKYALHKKKQLSVFTRANPQASWKPGYPPPPMLILIGNILSVQLLPNNNSHLCFDKRLNQRIWSYTCCYNLFCC